MKNTILKRGLVFSILVVLLSTSIVPSSVAHDKKADQLKDFDPTSIPITQKTTVISLSVFGKTGLEKQDITLSLEDALHIYSLFEDLKHQMTVNPFDEKTQQTQNQFLDLLEEKNALPQDTTKEELTTLLQPPILPRKHPIQKILPFESSASEWMCTFVSEGSGTVLPIIILPRLIPILLIPIPRAFVRWNVKEGFTSCGGLRSGTGFIAYGEQKGIALGFWGIGITFSLPPIMNTYGLIGYSLYASVSADTIEHYPPNTPPEITQTDPADGEQMVSLSTTELRFSIEDTDGDLMSYEVTTEPDIGSGSGGLKPDGIYSIPISGLESLTQYTWNIQVTDGKDTTNKICSFTTEPTAPLISNPLPADTQRVVPLTLTELKFTLTDFQGDLLDYTVETAPDIGSGGSTNVHNGTYTIPVSGLTEATMYRWFVNVTDGEHWTRKTFRFETTYPDVFNPFEYGWQYRKLLTVLHDKTTEDLINFPLLIHLIDDDLSVKAQETGDDILFMNRSGNAQRLNYEIESFDGNSGNLVAWINISQLSSLENTTLYMYYGNPNCLSQQSPQDTWDANYKGVWHMNDATYTTITDSTAGGHTGMKVSVNNPAETLNGKIAEAQHFIEADAITCSDSDDFSMTDETSDVPFTLELWMYPTAINNHHDLLTKDGQNRREWIFQYYGYQDYERFISIQLEDETLGTSLYAIYYYDFQPNLWYHFSVTYDGSGNLSGLTLYFNGVPVTWSTTTNTGYVKMRNTNAPLFMGKYDWPDPKYYYGIMDEVRISKGISRSEGWIRTCYQNQNDPSGFIYIGSEESGP